MPRIGHQIEHRPLNCRKSTRRVDFRIDFAAIAALIGVHSSTIMSSNPIETPTPLAEISQGPSAFEAFLDRNQKLLIVAAIMLALATAAYVIYQGVEKSRQETAGAALIDAYEIDQLLEVINSHSGTQAAKSAQVLLADAQWNNGEKDKAVDTLKKFLAAHPDHPATATAKASLAAKLMKSDQSAEATALFEDIVDSPESRHLAPYSLICIGDIARAAGDLAKAENAYSRIAAEFNSSAFYNTAELRLRDLKAKAPTAIDPPAELETQAPSDELEQASDAGTTESTADPKQTAPASTQEAPAEQDQSAETPPAPADKISDSKSDS